MDGLLIFAGGWPDLDALYGPDLDDVEAETQWRMCILYGHIPGESRFDGSPECARCGVGL